MSRDHLVKILLDPPFAHRNTEIPDEKLLSIADMRQRIDLAAVLATLPNDFVLAG
jgi:hypothetical protein